MKKSVLVTLALSIGLFSVAATSITTTDAQAKTINYGSIARSSDYDGVHFKFKLDKQLSRVTNNSSDWNDVAVYDTRITNRTNNSVKFYFTQMYMSSLSPDPDGNYTKRVDHPHSPVTVKPHGTITVYNSFRDTDNAAYSLFMPHKKDQDVLQYYRDNDYYLMNINRLHNSAKGYGWHPKNSWTNS